MLQAIRDKAQGWIAWAIVILISVPFALWGIQEYLGVGAEPVAAKVNGNEILERDLDRRARDFRENLRLTLGEAYRPDLITEDELRAQVLGRMIDERVLLEASSDWGMRASDAMVRGYIAGIPAFQQDGRFSQGLYESALRNRGMSPQMFESSVRQEIVLDQFRQAVRTSAYVVESELEEAARLEFQTRDIAYLLVPGADFRVEGEPPEAELEAYYREHSGAYRVPEMVSLQYLLLDVAELADKVPVTDDAIANHFEQHTLEFRAPEQRRVRHILVALPAGADAEAEAEALAEAQTLRQRLAAGEDFAALAAEASDDPGSAQLGGDLGWIEPGMMVEPFEEAAYELEPGKVSEPVRSQFGFHLIEVTDVKGGSDVEFADVRDEVEAAYRRLEAENQFYDFAERLADLSFENPGSLAPAAEALGLDVRQTEPFAENDPPELFASPKALAAAFGEEVLERGNNSPLIELGPDRVLVMRLLEHRPERVRDLAEVRAEVVEAYRTAQASAAAEAAGKELQAAVATGTTLEAASAEHGWQVERVEKLRRNDPRVPASLTATAFSLVGAEPVAGVAVGGDYAVLEVLEVEDGRLAELSDNERALLRNRLRNSRQTGEYDALLAALREAADIERRTPRSE
jgi:peptidyl-prolyl cis-trans isomerase D